MNEEGIWNTREKTIDAWAKSEVMHWAQINLARDTYLRRIEAHARMSLSRFILTPSMTGPEILPCNPDTLDDLSKAIVKDRFMPRVTQYLEMLRGVVDAENLPILIDVADMCPDSSDFPVFSFQKEAGSCIVLLPDVDFLESNFYLNMPADPLTYVDKSDTAVFAGSTTGGGYIDVDKLSNNLVQRISSARFFKEISNVMFYLPKIVHCSPAAEIILKSEGFGSGETFGWDRQLESKFLLSQDGHGATCSRIFLALASNSALIKYASPFVLYYFKSLSPWVHYIPASADRDVITALEVELRNPGFFHSIAENGRQFVEDYLTGRSVQLYAEKVVQALSMSLT